jgi:hypothetical protein
LFWSVQPLKVTEVILPVELPDAFVATVFSPLIDELVQVIVSTLFVITALVPVFKVELTDPVYSLPLGHGLVSAVHVSLPAKAVPVPSRALRGTAAIATKPRIFRYFISFASLIRH